MMTVATRWRRGNERHGIGAHVVLMALGCILREAGVIAP
eukprot:COSAG03_NODE_14566_length_459_cov_3.005376_1_plen_38_part_01